IKNSLRSDRFDMALNEKFYPLSHSNSLQSRSEGRTETSLLAGGGGRVEKLVGKWVDVFGEIL
uniref:hypothetical protein n=1 Tax=Enterocloster sp. TaxID=2719315 RepID=UPI00388F0CE5